MANKKTSKQLGAQVLVQTFFDYCKKEKDPQKQELFLNEFLQRSEVTSFLPQMITLLKKYEAKEILHNTLVIQSPASVDDYLVDMIIKKLQLEKDDVQKIVHKQDKNIIAGLKLTYKDISVDATLNNALIKTFTKTN